MQNPQERVRIVATLDTFVFSGRALFQVFLSSLWRKRLSKHHRKNKQHDHALQWVGQILEETRLTMRTKKW